MNFSALSDRSLIGRLARAPLRLIPKSAVVPILQGRLKGKKWIVGASNHGCWLGSFEYDKQQRMVDLIGSGVVCYDVGANVGFFSLLFSTLVGDEGQVYAFEPGPESRTLMERHIALNHCRNVDIMPIAIGNRNGFASFDTQTQSNSHCRLVDSGNLRVEIISLDDWIDQNNARPPQFLKIDVEGAETEVLDGARKTLQAHHPTIFLATHGPEERSSSLQILKELGYKVESFSNGGSVDLDEFLATKE